LDNQGLRNKSYQIGLNNQIIVGAGLGINFVQYRQLDVKTRPYRFYGHLTEFDIIRFWIDPPLKGEGLKILDFRESD